MRIDEIENKRNAIKIISTSNSGYRSGFTLKLLLNNNEIGHFKYFYDHDDFKSHNDVKVNDNYKGSGYGKLLLLKAIQCANDHGLGFHMDTSMTKEQQYVYDSLERDNLIVGHLGTWELTSLGEYYLADMGV